MAVICTNVNDVLEPVLEKNDLEPITCIQFIKTTVEKFGDKPALHYKKDSNWCAYTWKQYLEHVIAVGQAIVHAGIDERAGICILGFNRPEWFFCNIGGIFANNVVTGLYPTSNDDSNVYVINITDTQLVFVDDSTAATKILRIRSRCPKLKYIVQWDNNNIQDGVISYDNWLSSDENDAKALVERTTKQKPGMCCELVFTSGTTGVPKGVLISHDNLTFAARALIAQSHMGQLSETDSVVSFLPLCHVAAQIGDMWGPIAVGYQTIFAQPDALKGSLVQTLKETRPTLFLGVPRVYEKIMESMKIAGAENKGLKKSLIDWAKDIGLRGNRAMEQGQSVPWGWTLANWLVWSKVKTGMGLDRVRYFYSAASVLRPEVAEFYMKLNIYIVQIYGTSELSGPGTVGRPWDNHRSLVESIGAPIDGVQFKLDEDGELLVRGRNCFMGYLNDETSSHAAYTPDRWLRTGDLATVNEKGLYFVTGRKKELMKTSGGEYVAALPIEAFFLEKIQFLSQVVVVADQRKFVSMLLTIKSKVGDEQEALDDLSPPALLALKNYGITDLSTVSACIKDERVLKIVNEAIEDYNTHKAVSRTATVKRWVFLASDLSMANGCLTPTMKCRRNVVLEKHADIINKLYEKVESQ